MVRAADVFPPQPVGRVNDFAQVLSDSARQKIEDDLQTYEAQTTNEIAVVTLTQLPDGRTIEDVANQIFRTWGIGKKEKDNGVLFIAAVQDRKMRIEVGYGLEGDLTDLQTKSIQDDVVRPYFARGDYDGGIEAAVLSIEQTISGGPAFVSGSSNQEVADKVGVSHQNDFDDAFSSFFGFVGYILLFTTLSFVFRTISYIFGHTKSWWLGGVVGAVIGILAGLFFSSWLIVIFISLGGLIFDFIASLGYKRYGNQWWKYMSKSGGVIGGHGGGSGSSFSGGGGFGGGSSGGGGSSSSW